MFLIRSMKGHAIRVQVVEGTKKIYKCIPAHGAIKSDDLTDDMTLAKDLGAITIAQVGGAPATLIVTPTVPAAVYTTAGNSVAIGEDIDDLDEVQVYVEQDIKSMRKSELLSIAYNAKLDVNIDTKKADLITAIVEARIPIKE